MQLEFWIPIPTGRALPISVVFRYVEDHCQNSLLLSVFQEPITTLGW
jgi:hypothetical protein